MMALVRKLSGGCPVGPDLSGLSGRGVPRVRVAIPGARGFRDYLSIGTDLQRSVPFPALGMNQARATLDPSFRATRKSRREDRPSDPTHPVPDAA